MDNQNEEIWTSIKVGREWVIHDPYGMDVCRDADKSASVARAYETAAAAGISCKIVDAHGVFESGQLAEVACSTEVPHLTISLQAHVV